MFAGANYTEKIRFVDTRKRIMAWGWETLDLISQTFLTNRIHVRTMQ